MEKEAPKRLEKNNREYTLIKKYPYFALYEENKTKIREAFLYYDLGYRTKQVYTRLRLYKSNILTKKQKNVKI